MSFIAEETVIYQHKHGQIPGCTCTEKQKDRELPLVTHLQEVLFFVDTNKTELTKEAKYSKHDKGKNKRREKKRKNA